MTIKNLISGEKIDLIFKAKFGAMPEKGYVPKIVYNIVIHNTNYIVGECDARIGNNENTYWGGNIGYFIKEEERGHGYAPEAVKLLLQVFKDNGISDVYITNDISNLSSKRVCEKVGAKFIGVRELPLDNEMRKSGETHVNIFLIKL